MHDKETLVVLYTSVRQSPILFQLGSTVATALALSHCENASVDPSVLIMLHSRGIHGVDIEDHNANRLAIVEGKRILSAYAVDDERVYVITEADRSYTTVLLASEY